MFVPLLEPSVDTLHQLLLKLPDKWELRYNLFEENEITINTSDMEQLDGFIDKLDFQTIQDEFDHTISLKITKEPKPYVFFYSADKFYSLFSDEQLPLFLCYLSDTFAKQDSIVFECDESISEFCTQTLCLRNKGSELQPQGLSCEERNDKINATREHSHFFQTKEYALLPEDFFLNPQTDNVEIINSLNKLCTLFSMTSLCNHFDIKWPSFSAKLYGYKTISSTFSFLDMKIEVSEIYYKIYLWVYSKSGHISDKIGIARNLLSLHIQDKDFFTVTSEILTAIRTSFQIYLKDNITQYLSIKNNITNEVIEIVRKAMDLSAIFSSNFKNNFLGFVSFFVTVLILNTVSSGKISNIFTKDISLLTFGFLFISFLFLGYSLWEICSSKKQINVLYNNIKCRYDKLLESKDLEDVFNHDEEITLANRIICGNIRFVSIMWLLSILVFSLIVIYLMPACTFSFESLPSIIIQR
ncbi:MAG: hypothetical protein JXK07_10080 [Spirochaetes bacterium]|nr:hypothetical protein [Spirochaetota bacterium]